MSDVKSITDNRLYSFLKNFTPDQEPPLLRLHTDNGHCGQTRILRDLTDERCGY